MERLQPPLTSDILLTKSWKKQKTKNHGSVMNKNTSYSDKKVVTNTGHLVSQEEVMPHHKDNTIAQLVPKTLLEEPSQKPT